MKVSILGAGSMGTAVSLLLANNGMEVYMWSVDQNEIDMINSCHEQKEKLPGVILPSEIKCYSDLEYVIDKSELIVFAIPSQFLRSCVNRIKPYYKKGQMIASFTKGLEIATSMRMTEIIRRELKGSIPVAMSGPCHAEELGRCMPSAYVAACRNIDAAKKIQSYMMAPYFRVYTNCDVIGVEVGGALKNIIALCCGIIEGIGFGDNTKAALMTRGMVEMRRLGVAMGGKKETFSGLSGYGDLVVTCTSMLSRNKQCGILIGKGRSLEEAVKETKMAVEGVHTTKAAKIISDRLNVNMPITSEAYKVLFEGANPMSAIEVLMTRDMTNEEKF